MTTNLLACDILAALNHVTGNKYNWHIIGRRSTIVCDDFSQLSIGYCGRREGYTFYIVPPREIDCINHDDWRHQLRLTCAGLLGQYNQSAPSTQKVWILPREILLLPHELAEYRRVTGEKI